MDLISVIVPVYNVEPYLKRCILSILAQTYSYLEIILIDDGSTDNSGKICDSFAEKNSNITVIHQKNQGLSSARNTGLDYMHGSYVTFIDSDDYIAKDYIEHLYNLSQQYHADYVACSTLKFSNKIRSKSVHHKKNSSILVLTPEQALENMLYHWNLSGYAHSKIYHRDIFCDLRFPYGKLFEDSAICCKAIDNAHKIVVSPYKKYYYFQRPESIVHSTFRIQKLDLLTFCEEIECYISDKYPTLYFAAISKYFVAAIDLYTQIPSGTKYADSAKLLENIIKKYRKKILFDRKNKILIRIIAFFSFINIKCLRWLRMVYNKISDQIQKITV